MTFSLSAIDFRCYTDTHVISFFTHRVVLSAQLAQSADSHAKHLTTSLQPVHMR